MTERGRAGLERIAHGELLSVGSTAAVMLGLQPAVTAPHAQPGWKVVVAHDGVVGGWTSEGAIQGEVIVVPPGLRHRAWSTGAYTSVLLDPGLLPGPAGAAGILSLDREQLPRDVLGGGATTAAQADEVARELVPALARRVPIAVPTFDGRVLEALARLADDVPMHVTASAVGVSPSHLRRLVQRQLGAPLNRIRHWQRLRAAVLAPGPLSAAAVTAGFADQSHLTRTARALVGRTPSDITRARAVAAS